MAEEIVNINPKLLQWARYQTGFSLKEAATKARICSKYSIKPEERLLSWEEGRAYPTFSQLEALSRAYYTPLMIFFMRRPPKQSDWLLDYRTPNIPKNPKFNALKIRVLCLQRELWAIAKEEEAEALPFVGSCLVELGVMSTVYGMRSTLNITPDDLRHKSSNDTFRILRDKAQMIGIYVIIMGDLGNYKTKVSTNQFRGIAIADQLAPLIAINNNDAQYAMLFTLVQELVHIFIAASGISNQDIFDLQSLPKTPEQFCHAVASEFLVPEKMLMAEWISRDDSLDNFIERMKDNFGVSSEIIVRRLFDLKLIEMDAYENFVTSFRSKWELNINKERKYAGCSNLNMLKYYNFGEKVLSTLWRAVDEDMISILDAARTLNMSVSRFDKIVEYVYN